MTIDTYVPMVRMHLPPSVDPETPHDHIVTGYRVSFACGHDAVIPAEFFDSYSLWKENAPVLDRCTCPGCGATAQIISVVWKVIPMETGE